MNNWPGPEKETGTKGFGRYSDGSPRLSSQPRFECSFQRFGRTKASTRRSWHGPKCSSHGSNANHGRCPDAGGFCAWRATVAFLATCEVRSASGMIGEMQVHIIVPGKPLSTERGSVGFLDFIITDDRRWLM